MMLMTEPAQLRAALADIRPTHVAVAYLGYGWSEYLDVTALEEIVVSPTLGSFPYALDDLLDAAARHGISVYFQPDLHAKLFIGSDSCLIGSANLSRNGFFGGLREAGVYLQGADSVQQAQAVFATLKAGAVTSPDRQRAMVSELVETWQRARRHGVLPNEAGDRPDCTITDWKPGVERVHLAWFDARVGIPLNEASIRQQLPEIGHYQPEEYFEDYASLVEGDDVKPGDWLILWAARSDGAPNLRSDPYWLRVDQLIPDAAGASEAPYTQLAVTLPGGKMITPPFELDGRTRRLIKQLLASGDYPALLWSDAREPWRFKDAREDNQRFLADLQQACRDEAASD